MVSVSGITPSGHLTLGNYLGALRRFGASSDGSFYFVSDLHAMTTEHDPTRLAQLTRETATLMLASGLPNGSVFIQSAVPAHLQLSYLIECTAHMGELSRMIQYREKGRDRPATRASLLTYPCLMAADILLYDATQVPVGNDQDQHVELARDLAQRFNRMFGDTFVIPEPLHGVLATRIKDLEDPQRKMSKSAPDDASGVIRLLDRADAVRRKVMRAVTDSESTVRYDPERKPGVSNLLEVLAAIADDDPRTLARRYSSYGELKKDVADAVISVLEPVQERYADLVDHPSAVDWALEAGRKRATAVADRRLQSAYRAIGLASAVG